MLFDLKKGAQNSLLETRKFLSKIILKQKAKRVLRKGKYPFSNSHWCDFFVVIYWL